MTALEFTVMRGARVIAALRLLNGIAGETVAVTGRAADHALWSQQGADGSIVKEPAPVEMIGVVV